MVVLKVFYATYACVQLAQAREQNMNVARRTNRERQLALAHNLRLYSASSMQPIGVPRWAHPKRVLPRSPQLIDVFAEFAPSCLPIVAVGQPRAWSHTNTT